jgi:hypothetical protein
MSPNEQQMKRISDRAEESAGWLEKGQVLTPWAKEKYRQWDLLSLHCDVQRCDADVQYVTYTASQDRKRRTVNLKELTCSCLQWQQLQLPCVHAIAAGRSEGMLNDMGTWYEHAFSPVYMVKHYAAAYAGKRACLPMLERLVPDGQTKPAQWVRQPGRAKKKRIRSRGESALLGQPPIKKYKCQICGQTGHNKKTCTAHPW